MQPGFVSGWVGVGLAGRPPSAVRCAPAPHCWRAPSRRARPGPFMAGKFQQQEEPGQQLDQESELEKLVAPPALPTLTTLTDFKAGRAEDDSEIDLSRISGARDGDGDEEVRQMGPALSADQEGSVIAFLQGVVAEARLVEWPTPAHVARFTLIILGSLGVAITALYLVDGFFYRMAQIVFDGKI